MNRRPQTPPFGQRLPFFPPLIAAMAGILASPLLPTPIWIGLCLTSAAIFFARKSLATFLALFVIAFGLIQAWQGWDSAAAQWSRTIGDRPETVQLRGIVLTEPRLFAADRSAFEMMVTAGRTSDNKVFPDIRVLVNWQGQPPTCGDAVKVFGLLANLEPPRNPGQFDFAAWSARRGVPLCLTVSHPNDAQILGSPQGSWFLGLASRARSWMSSTLTRQVNDPLAANLLLAMVIGDTSSMPVPIKDEFRGTGTFHLFSVSGLHVGMLAVLLWYVFKVLQIPRPYAAALTIPLLFFYAFLTGAQPSSMRAAIMAAIVLSGLIVSRRPILLNNLCAAALFILAFDSNQLFQAGFQLSFCVVAAIFFLARGLTPLLERPFQPDPFLPGKLLPAWKRQSYRGGQKLAGLTGVSLAAWLGSLPLTLGYFQFVSLSALPCNLLAVPLSFAIMAVAMLSLLGGPWLSAIFNQTNWALCQVLLATVHGFASLPGSFFYLEWPRLNKPATEVIVFDCGSGGAAWISSRQCRWLIDCGPQKFQNQALVPFLRSRGCAYLDGLAITHGDAGHMGGAWPLLARLRIGTLIDSPLTDRSILRRQLHQELARSARPKSLHRDGDQVVLENDLTLRVLYPPAGLPREIADDKTLVLLLQAGPTRILFLSDAGLFTEEWLLEHHAQDLPCDILVRNFPGRGPWGSPDFLRAAGPKAMIIGGENLPGGESTPTLPLSPLENSPVRVFRQDHTGAVSVRIFSHSCEISAFLGGHHFQFLR